MTARGCPHAPSPSCLPLRSAVGLCRHTRRKSMHRRDGDINLYHTMEVGQRAPKKIGCTVQCQDSFRRGFLPTNQPWPTNFPPTYPFTHLPLHVRRSVSSASSALAVRHLKACRLQKCARPSSRSADAVLVPKTSAGVGAEVGVDASAGVDCSRCSCWCSWRRLWLSCDNCWKKVFTMRARIRGVKSAVSDWLNTTATGKRCTMVVRVR